MKIVKKLLYPVTLVSFFGGGFLVTRHLVFGIIILGVAAGLMILSWKYNY